jgi:hypothetical protein
MPKFKVRMWCTSASFKDVEIEADNVGLAETKGFEIAMNDDTSKWNSYECDFEVDAMETKEA